VDAPPLNAAGTPARTRGDTADALLLDDHDVLLAAVALQDGQLLVMIAMRMAAIIYKEARIE
jgi:hypothetical protein